MKPVYYSNAVIGLAPPSTRVDNVAPGVPLPRNGLLDIGGAPLIANMTAVGLREPSVVDRVVAAGGLPDYVSKMFPVPATSPQLPLIMIEATAADPAAATKTLELVVAQAEVTLRTPAATSPGARRPDGGAFRRVTAERPSGGDAESHAFDDSDLRCRRRCCRSC